MIKFILFCVIASNNLANKKSVEIQVYILRNTRKMLQV
jgi:hypothetical protein